MKPVHFFFLFIAAVLGWCAYDHASSVKASLADAAVDAGFNQLGIDKQERAEIGNTTKQVVKAVKAGVDSLSGPQHVSAPAAVSDSAIHDELRGEIEALKSRVGTLERQPPCTCARDAKTAPAAPTVTEVPQVIYQDACANGNCGSGRRRGRWAK